MPVKKISNINDEIDVKLFLDIIGKNIHLIGLLLLITLISSFFYLRYTHPVFEAKAVIQLETNEEMKQILGNQIPEDDLQKKTELLRSQTFLERTLNKLSLQVKYFKEGTILDYELYKSCPYEVTYKVINPLIYKLPVHVKFIDKNRYEIFYSIDKNTKRKKELYIWESAHFPEVEIKLNILKSNEIISGNKILIPELYYFIINNPDDLVSEYIPNLTVTVLNPSARTIQVVLQDYNGQKASEIVNTIVQEFQEYDVEKKAESTNKTLEFIDKQLKGIYDKLIESEVQLENFKKENKIDTVIDRSLPNYYSRINDMENELVKIELEENILKDVEKRLTNNKDIDIYGLSMVVSGSEFKSSFSNLINSLQDLLIKKEELHYEVTDYSGQIKSLNYRIDIQKKLILENVKIFKNDLTSRKTDLTKKVEDYNNSVFSKTGKYNPVELSRLQRLYSINDKYYNELIARKVQFSIDQAGYVSRAAVLEYSKIPTVPVTPIKSKIYSSAFGLAFLIIFLIVILKYLFYNEIASFEDIIKFTDRPVIGIIPKYRLDIPVSQLIVDKRPKSIIAESFRVIRTNLQFISNEPGPKIIAVTSTISGEGKTFFAINLAGVIAFSNKKVIILDSDMRKPKIHLGFDVENRHGLSTILVGKDSVEKCTNQSVIENLNFITAGPVPPNPSELILDKRMDILLEELKSKYDYVIIDNPPIGLVTDGMKSLTIADYPIYVMRANHSRRTFIQNVNRLVEESNIKRISIVLNVVSPKYSNYSYSNKYKGYRNFYGSVFGNSFGYGYAYGYGYGVDEDDFTEPSWIAKIMKKFFNQ